MDSLVQARPGKRKHNSIAPRGVLAVNPSDVYCFPALARCYGLKRRFLFNSQFFTGPDFFVAGPAVGAPMAALSLESLIALGAKCLILYSWCGSLHPSLQSGAFFMPTSAVSEEGTSKHYPYEEENRDCFLENALQSWLVRQGHVVQQGPLWSTDAPFRETREKISAYAGTGVWAVDMEYAALRAVAAFRQVELAALFTVSDELFHDTWRPAFTSQAFRRRSQERLQHLCTFLGDQQS